LFLLPRRQVKNSYSLRVALLTDVFVRVIPLPLPPDSAGAKAGQCIWAPGGGAGVRHETQLALLHVLGLAARHLACACQSVRPTRSLDACRCVAFACVAAMGDAAVRIVAGDFPSQVRVHPTARRGGCCCGHDWGIGRDQGHEAVWILRCRAE
jgi:hypothetical protein